MQGHRRQQVGQPGWDMRRCRPLLAAKHLTQHAVHAAPCRAHPRAEERAHDLPEDAPAVSAARVERLGVLIRLRKLYRNLLRAEGLLAEPSPVYQPYRRPGAL